MSRQFLNIFGFLIAAFIFFPQPVQANPCKGFTEWDSGKFKSFTHAQMKSCLQNGLDPNARDIDKFTVLHIVAAYNPDPSIIDLLIEFGGDPNAVREKYGKQYESVVYMTVFHNKDKTGLPKLKKLIKAGARLDNFVKRYDPFVGVKRGVGKQEMNDYLIAARAGCANWGTVEFLSSSNSEQIRQCVANGLEVNRLNANGYSPLHLIAKHDLNPEIATALLEAGADMALESKTDDRAAPIHLAAQNTSTNSLLSAFLKFDGNAFRIRDSKHGGNALHWAASNQSAEPLSFILENGVSINSRNGEGYTPLHISAFSNSPKAMSALLNVDAKFEDADKEGRRVTHFAAWFMNKNAMQSLIDAGVELSAIDRSGNNALHYAAWHSKDTELLSLLVSQGIDPNQPNSRGDTPLHLAAADNKYEAIIAALLELGAKANIPNSQGNFPVDLAKRNDALKNTDTYWTLNDAKFE